MDAPSTAATCAVLAAESGEIVQRILIRLLADVGELVPAYVSRFVVSDIALDRPFKPPRLHSPFVCSSVFASEAARRLFCLRAGARAWPRRHRLESPSRRNR